MPSWKDRLMTRLAEATGRQVVYNNLGQIGAAA